MADATQVQIRRDTYTNLASATPVEAELGFDQTNKRIVIGDGTTAGGISHVNYLDARVNLFNGGTVGGTGNAITLTMTPPVSSYLTNMEVVFLATSSNTGPTTININGVGARNIQKLSSGSLQNLASGDIVSGSYVKIIYNGTSFQLITVFSGGITSVSQGNLNTSTGTFSGAPTYTVPGSIFQIGFSGITLPGGQYGFSIETFGTGGGTNNGWFFGSNTAAYVSHGTPWGIGISSASVFGRQRYISSSPPFNLGDGDVGGFIYALVNSAGDIVSHYAADVPPWGYNGKTDITCYSQCPVTKKKFRRVMKKRSFEEIMDGAKISYVIEEITNDIKNRDMASIPHPFGNLPEGHHVVLLDPMDDKISRIVEYQNSGGDDLIEQIKGGKILIGDKCKRCGPKGVHIHKMKYKYTGKF